ncbi:MAG: hypothetical protein LBL09_04835 [Oscillospiraceae bacterium]|jgi:hypothetical protein|nr:hypothetical protein [Oscillospiraceae bacterium]
MKKKRLFNEIYNAGMTLAWVSAAMILIQKLLLTRFPAWTGLLCMLPCLLAYPSGRLMHRFKPKAAIPAGAVLSALLVILPLSAVRVHDLYFYILIPLLLSGTFVLYVIPYISGSNLMSGTRFLCGGAVMLLAAVIKGENPSHGVYAAYLNTGAVIYIVLGLFLFNNESLLYAASPGGRTARMPAGMRRSNFIIVALFIALAFAVANFEALRIFVIDVIAFMLSLFFWILSLFGGSEGDGEMSGSSNIDLGGEANPSGWFVELLYTVIKAAAITAFAALIIYILYKAIRQASTLIRGFFDRMSPAGDMGYIDEIEDLREEDKAEGGFFRRLFQNFIRPKRFEDMPDNRAKVRFAYKTMLKRLSKENRRVLTSTPNETLPEAEQISQQLGAGFIDSYNKARYSQAEVTDKETGEAKEMYKLL